MSPYFLILSFVAVVFAQDATPTAPEEKPAEPAAEPKPRVQGNCPNLFVYDFTCNTLANSGHCEQEPSKVWMSKMCSKACNSCDAIKHDIGKDCENRHNDARCEAWAVWGRCAEGGAIHRECARSCNTCEYMNEQIRLERLDWLEPEPEEPTKTPEAPKPSEPAAAAALYRYYRRYFA